MEVQLVETNVISEITKGEIDMQVATAKRYPRNLPQVMKNIFAAGTYNEQTMESLVYSLPQGQGAINGPSVRLAEIIACEYQNLLVQSRIISENDKEIVAQGCAWDMEKNVKVSVEVSRSIIDKYGKKFKESVIKSAKMAAISIAYRNAIFKIFPRAHTDAVLDKIQKHNTWPIEELGKRRDSAIKYITEKGVPLPNILNYLNIEKVEDIGVQQVNQLRYALNSERDGEFTLAQIFTDPRTKEDVKTEDQKIQDTKDKLAGNDKK